MRVFVNGSNSRGQLNETILIGEITEKDKLIEMKLNFKIKLIACGYYHVLILTENNELFGCGANEDGQLGVGDLFDKYEFTKIDTDKFLDVTTNNSLRKLNPFSIVKSLFTKKKDITKVYNSDTDTIKSIACGAYFSTLLTDNNNLFLTGQEVRKQLGLKDKFNLTEFTKCNFNFGKIKTIKCTASSVVILNENGQFYKYFYDLTFKLFYWNPDIVDFHCGFRHIIFLDKYGQLFCLLGEAEEVTHCKVLNKIKQISSQYYSFSFLNEMNELFVIFCGLDSYLKNNKLDTKTEMNGIKIDKFISGLSHRLYFISTNKDICYSNFEYSNLHLNANQLCLEKNNLTEEYIYPITGYDFIYVIASDYPLFGAVNNKEIERMFQVLFEQLTERQSFCDLSFI